MREPGCARTIVVVDDDPGIREGLTDLLGDEGYEVVTAEDGREALHKLRQEASRRPCLILLDLMMPVMSGAQFYREQQADPALASIPVCLISADGDLRNKAAALGCEFLEKPGLTKRIFEVIECHCAGTAEPPAGPAN
jgi:CheY-like chemotaxis protein